MMEFLDALARHEILQRTLLAGLLSSLACGVIGSYVVVRRISYVAGGISHCVLGGLGAAVYLNRVCHWRWLDPMYGAVAAALVAALIIGWVSLRFKQREDTVISALWAVGMAIGLLFMAKGLGYGQELMSYLFGSIAIVSSGDLWLLAGLDLLVLGVGLIFYKQFLAVCFDEEHARVRGVNVEFYYLLLLCLTALSVVLLMKAVGIVMVIAMLTLPVAVAGYFSRRLWQMMVLATLLCGAFTTTGFAISYGPDLPTGPVIVVLAGGAYLVVMIARGVVSYLRKT